MEAGAAGVVFGRRDVSRKVIGTDGRNGGRGAFWRREKGKRWRKRSGLRERKWNEKTLEAKRKGDFGKIAIARQLRAETKMTHRWIAERLRMGTTNHLTHLLYWEKRKKTEAK